MGTAVAWATAVLGFVAVGVWYKDLLVLSLKLNGISQ